LTLVASHRPALRKNILPIAIDLHLHRYGVQWVCAGSDASSGRAAALSPDSWCWGDGDRNPRWKPPVCGLSCIWVYAEGIARSKENCFQPRCKDGDAGTEGREKGSVWLYAYQFSALNTGLHTLSDAKTVLFQPLPLSSMLCVIYSHVWNFISFSHLSAIVRVLIWLQAYIV